METSSNGWVVDISTPSTLEFSEAGFAVMVTCAVMAFLFSHTVDPLCTATVGICHGVLNEREASVCLFTPSALIPLAETRLAIRTSAKLTTMQV